MEDMSEGNYSSDFGTPFGALVNHFESNDIRFHADQDGKSVQFYITGDCAAYNCRFQITHNDEIVEANILFPVAARDDKVRSLATEMVVRANRGMSLGAFDADVDTGQISFHVGQVIPGGVLEDQLIGGLFVTCMTTCDRYFPALMRVMFGGHTPADAVYLSELDIHAEGVEWKDVKTTPAPHPQKPSAKKRRSPRRDPRSKSTRDLPGLFDETPDQDGKGPRRG